MIFASFSEMISIGSVVPFLGVLVNPEQIFNNKTIQPLIELYEITQPEQLILPVTIFFVAAILCSGLTRFLLLWAQMELSSLIGGDIGNELYRKVLYQSYLIHISRNSSEVIAGIMTKTKIVIHSILIPTITISSSILILCSIIISLIYINSLATLLIFGGFGFLYYLINLVVRKKIQENGKIISEKSTKIIKILQEGLGGIRDIIINGNQSYFYEMYRETDFKLRRSQASTQIIIGAPRIILEVIGISLIALFAYYMTIPNVGISSAIPTLGLFAVAAQRILPILQQLYQGISTINGAWPSLAEVLQLLDLPISRYSGLSPLPPIIFEKEIKFNNVGFKYPGSDSWAIRNINFSIDKGAKVGIIGASGSGKSTLIDVLMGLLMPTEGAVEIDGLPLREDNARSWQVLLSHVPQSIFYADATIAENIAFGLHKNEIDLERVHKAAFKARISDVIEKLSQKYNTEIGERGFRLSGGQRQRIGIARAFYINASVIIFDEATSALDEATEASVMQSIDLVTGNPTVIIVTHRLKALKDCNFIIELDGGKIKNIYTYNDLMENF
ncbi:MAG: ABC transporter ATP-binding protein/permease [Bacteroidetes bacterium]|nr:ABC transporter ATP-binding protein/permease [Bacteroidota bacterium]